MTANQNQSENALSSALAAKLLGLAAEEPNQTPKVGRQAILMKTLQTMSPLEIQVIKLRCFYAKSNAETALIIGLSTSVSRQVFIDSMAKLKKKLEMVLGLN